MKFSRRVIILAALAACLMPTLAGAQECPGVFIRDSQSYDTGNDPNVVERRDVVIAKGTRDLIVGYVMVGGKKYYQQLRAFRHDPADVRLKAGCILGKY